MGFDAAEKLIYLQQNDHDTRIGGGAQVMDTLVGVNVYTHLKEVR